MIMFTMLQGMTGFGSAERGCFRVEVRSLNHRFLDLAVKMPSQLAEFEMDIRDAVKERFSRGRVEVFVSTNGTEKIRVSANAELASEIYSALNGLRKTLEIKGEVTVGDMLGFKEMFRTEAKYDRADLMACLGEAVAGTEKMRLREGESIKAEIFQRTGAILSLNLRIGALAPSALEDARAKFVEKVKSFAGAELCDEVRLINEASRASERADISEEISRIGSHIEYLRGIITEGGRSGRKLDFILQELNREANTMASKAENTEIVRMAVEMKAEIESVREQIQNIQ